MADEDERAHEQKNFPATPEREKGGRSLSLEKSTRHHCEEDRD